MARRQRIGLLVVVALLIVASGCANNADEDRVAGLETRVEQLQEEKEQLQEENTELEQDITELEKRLATILEPREEDPLAWQPHMAFLELRETPFPSPPGTTEWKVLDEHPLLDLTGGSPAEVLVSFAQALAEQGEFGMEVPAELIVRLRRNDDTATGVILRWGLLDDSVAGIDYRLELHRDGAQWMIHTLEVRYHCQRGINDNLCV